MVKARLAAGGVTAWALAPAATRRVVAQRPAQRAVWILMAPPEASVPQEELRSGLDGSSPTPARGSALRLGEPLRAEEGRGSDQTELGLSAGQVALGLRGGGIGGRRNGCGGSGGRHGRGRVCARARAGMRREGGGAGESEDGNHSTHFATSVL